MTAADWQGWVSYYGVEPFGFPRDESRHATLLANMYSLHGNAKTPKKFFELNHWKYKHVDETDEDDEAEVMRLLGG